jgi:hypothetical protein
LIIPVLWVPIAKPPPNLAELQYTQYGVTDQEYKQLGLRNLIRIKRRNYVKFLATLAQAIVQALEEHKLPSASALPVFEQIQDAFQESPSQTDANNPTPTEDGSKLDAGTIVEPGRHWSSLRAFFLCSRATQRIAERANATRLLWR